MPSDEARQAVEGMCMLFHTSVRTLAQNFLTQLQRHYYATPTSYLELISTYKTLLAAKRTQVYTLKHRCYALLVAWSVPLWTVALAKCLLVFGGLVAMVVTALLDYASSIRWPALPSIRAAQGVVCGFLVCLCTQTSGLFVP